MNYEIKIKGPRAQADRELYRFHMQEALQNTKNLHCLESSVEDLLLTEDENKIKGLILGNGEKIYSSSIIITTGTFLGGLIHIGTFLLFSKL